MDVAKAITAYIDRMVKEVQGMKVLLLDAYTVRCSSHQTPTISATFTQSALLENEVYLTDKITKSDRERMPHLQCIGFVRPCAGSVQALCDELKAPRYGSYWLCTSLCSPRLQQRRVQIAD